MSADLLPPSHHYEIEFLFLERVELDPGQLAADLGKRHRDLEASLVDDGRALALQSHDGEAQWILRRAGLSAGELEESISQTWHWGPGRDIAARSIDSIRLIDHASRIEYRERLARFRGIAASITAALAPDAIHWVESQQIVDPGELLRAEEEKWGDPLLFALNVRYFRIEPEDAYQSEAFVMDTIGLAPLGLPDVQCHFRHLDPKLLAPVLYDTAQTIFEKGPVLLSGTMVAGIDGASWRVQFEDSIAEPLRGVLDLDPGKPYAAGTRTSRWQASGSPSRTKSD